MNTLNKLPNLSTSKPTYSTKLPTTNEEIEYQSYTKKEEKAILIASHEKDYPTLIATLNNILSTHCSKELQTVVDFTYVLTHIRAKSHGESHTFKLKKCECGKEDIQIKVENILDHIKIKNADKLNLTYQVTDKIALRLCPTKIGMIKKMKFNDTPENALIQINSMIANSIEYVVSEKQIIKDFTSEQLIENIIQHLTPFQIEEINKMIGEMIRIVFDVKYHCDKCKTDYKKEISDFLFSS